MRYASINFRNDIFRHIRIFIQFFLHNMLNIILINSIYMTLYIMLYFQTINHKYGPHKSIFVWNMEDIVVILRNISDY